MTLLEKVKKNLILEHNEDDALVESFITAATAYAEGYQKRASGFYRDNTMDPTTEHLLVCQDERYNILSVEDIREKGMYIEVLAEKVEGSKG